MTKTAKRTVASSHLRTVAGRLTIGAACRGVPAHRAGRLAVISPTVLVVSALARGRRAYCVVMSAIIGPTVTISSRPEAASTRAEAACVHVMDHSARASHGIFRLGPRRQQNFLKVVKVLL